MKTKISKFLNKILNSPFIVFISLIDLLIGFFEKAYEITLKDLQINQIQMDASYFEISIRLLTVIFLYFLWRAFLRTKKSVEYHLNQTNEHWYKELTKLDRITNNKIRFIHFNNEYKDLPKEEYLKKLTLEGGFSKDDLLEIGVDEKLITENKNHLFSKNVMEKFLTFKKELKDEQNNDGTS
ncbi:hypothetical protein Q4Q34_09005 [Flavivirga abyssicola]|uniref:hypothetical protein n=1 Tax=Flavivirga abyssicola TaxID=3063533 RepID=UPI0026E0B2DD|nr:hypothetical protein [Flavivirga sp. MEBiC07777]WVK15165.1 hypothetical protein Q4Q34_09005 [Flavivirga sp. MEBiC07777]